MAGRKIGGWSDAAVEMLLPADQVGVIIEGLTLARVHLAECMHGATSPAGAHAHDQKLLAAVESLALALGEKVSKSPGSAKWRELLSDPVREYVVAFWRGWNGGV